MVFVLFIVLLFAAVGGWQYYQAYTKQVAQCKHYAPVDRNPIQTIFKMIHLS